MAVVSAGTFTEKFRQIGNIPTLPHAATKALAIANDPKCSINDFCKVIEGDPALATSLLKLVNSSFYAGATRISNLTTAVTRLGLRETQNLILAVSVRSVFRWMPKNQQEERDRLWRHCGLTAVLSRQLNNTMGLGFDGEEFASGLSHDLGRIMLAVGYPDVFSKLAESDVNDEDTLIREEQEALGFTHTDLGGWLAGMWNLPPELAEAIQYHHQPTEAPNHPILASVVCVAERMANHMESTHSAQGLDLAGNPGWEFMRSQWDSVAEIDARDLATAVMMESVTEAEALVKITLQ